MYRWLLAALAALLCGCGGESRAVAPQPTGPEYGTVTEAALCGDDDDVAAAIEAAHNKDRAAIAGLISRGKVKPLIAGTKLEITYRRPPLMKVRIASGTYMNERCWTTANATQ